MSRTDHRRRRRLGAPRPVCPYGCGARVVVVQLGRGETALVERNRVSPTALVSPPARWAVRRTGSDTGVGRPWAPRARPLEPNEHLHHDHDDVCPARGAYVARLGAAAAEDVVDVTRPRRTDT